MLAMKTGAPILPMAIHRQRDETYLITVKPPLDMRYTGDRERDLLLNTAACTRALESFIRQEPSQWVWMHNRWRKKLGQENELAWKEFFNAA
jgi:KDO2-lipid IV(A) lauroyltransferase